VQQGGESTHGFGAGLECALLPFPIQFNLQQPFIQAISPSQPENILVGNTVKTREEHLLIFSAKTFLKKIGNFQIFCTG
jgi:hypothetical protein